MFTVGLIARLRERKLVQWGLAYLAGAWVLLQVLDQLSGTFAWSPVILRVVTALAGVGFFAALVLAYYHGERGEQRVPGSEVALLSVLFLLAGLVGWTTSRSQAVEGLPAVGPAAPLPTRSVAVLPFENYSSDSTNAYFAAGVHEEVLTQLSKIRDLKVISRTSVMQYAQGERNLREIGRALGAGSILEGSVQRVGNRVRITAQLIDARTDDHLWAERYDRDLEDIFAIQSEVALEIAKHLNATLSTGERARIERQPTENIAAYDLYLKGRHFWNRRTLGDLQVAQEHFVRATDLDPTFAPAWAGLADVYALLGAPSYGYRPPREMYELARGAALRALQLDSTLAEAHATLGLTASNFDWEWAAAERHFLKAIELDPGYASAHQWYSLLLVSLGRVDEALREAERGKDLDPLSLTAHGNVARIHYFARQYDKALPGYRDALAVGAGTSWPHVGMAMVHAAQDRHTEALERLDLVTASFGGRTESTRGYVYAAMGRREEARQILAQLIQRPEGEYTSPTSIAIIHGALGQKDQAFRWLDRAYEERAGDLRFLSVEPLFQPLRSDVRFARLVRRMQLD